MSKRKFKKGAQVRSLDEFFLHEYFIVNGKTQHCGWCRAWQLGLARHYIERGAVFVAVRLTNGEYYSGKSDDEIQSMLDTALCNIYCPLPDHLKGVHCYGGEPVMCEGSHCREALEAWKEEEVDE